MAKFNYEALAQGIETEAKHAADLSLLKSELALQAQAGLNGLGVSGARAVSLAFQFSDEAENAVTEWASRKSVKAGMGEVTLSAQGKHVLLERLGSGLIDDFCKQYEQARDAALIRQKEQRQGIIRK